MQTGQELTDKNMYAYCGNNPINRYDPNGHFWAEIGNFFKSVGNAIASVFGASASTSVAQETPVVKTPAYSPVSVTTGTKASTVTSSKGNSSKPITVSAGTTKISNNPISSSASVKVNIMKASLGLNVGLSDLGLQFSIKNGKSTVSTKVRIDITKLQIGFEAENETETSTNTSVSSYVNTSVNGGFAAAAYMFLQSGSFSGATQPAY